MKGQRGLYLAIALALCQMLSSLSGVRSCHLRSLVTLAQTHERTRVVLANVIFMTSLALRFGAALKWAGGQVIHLTFWVNIYMLMYWDKSVVDQGLS